MDEKNDDWTPLRISRYELKRAWEDLSSDMVAVLRDTDNGTHIGKLDFDNVSRRLSELQYRMAQVLILQPKLSRGR